MTTYKIKIQSSGEEFEIKPSQTILEGAIAAGITIPYGCQDGACGSCKGKIISGKFFLDDHQSSALTESDIKFETILKPSLSSTRITKGLFSNP